MDYGTWREHGLLIATEGNTVDHEAIRRKIHELARVYRIRELAYDRWNSSMLINQLVNDGLNCVPVAQSNGAMNAPARELERVLAAGTLRHGANPILRWCDRKRHRARRRFRGYQAEQEQEHRTH